MANAAVHCTLVTVLYRFFSLCWRAMGILKEGEIRQWQKEEGMGRKMGRENACE